ncbi:MAG: hypothetical protein IJ461_08000, partial [Clostridia bacterium]|nr:hypothetical protein [Clostridia bacterium]
SLASSKKWRMPLFRHAEAACWTGGFLLFTIKVITGIASKVFAAMPINPFLHQICKLIAMVDFQMVARNQSRSTLRINSLKGPYCRLSSVSS